MNANIAGMTRQVFVDTSAYFALLDPRDARHAAAQPISSRLMRESWRLYTTNYVVAETHALILARRGRVVAAEFLREIDHSDGPSIRVSEADEERAREIIYTVRRQRFLAHRCHEFRGDGTPAHRLCIRLRSPLCPVRCRAPRPGYRYMKAATRILPLNCRTPIPSWDASKRGSLAEREKRPYHAQSLVFRCEDRVQCGRMSEVGPRWR
jgi:predicted nucleic acid-binding protein